MLLKTWSSVESKSSHYQLSANPKVLVMGFGVFQYGIVPRYGQLDKQLFSHAVLLHEIRMNNLYYVIFIRNFQKKFPGIIHMTER